MNIHQIKSGNEDSDAVNIKQLNTIETNIGTYVKNKIDLFEKPSILSWLF